MTESAWYGVNGLELGVSGLVHALNAVGIVTAASCRSHNQSHSPWSDYPIVVFAANREQLALLQPLVEASGCGFEVDSIDRPELIAVVAPSVLETMAFGKLVLALTAGLALAPTPRGGQNVKKRRPPGRELAVLQSGQSPRG